MKEKAAITTATKKIKYLGINLRNMQDLDEENFKTSTEGHIWPKEMEMHTIFLDNKIFSLRSQFSLRQFANLTKLSENNTQVLFFVFKLNKVILTLNGKDKWKKCWKRTIKPDIRTVWGGIGLTRPG